MLLAKYHKIPPISTDSPIYYKREIYMAQKPVSIMTLSLIHGRRAAAATAPAPREQPSECAASVPHEAGG